MDVLLTGQFQDHQLLYATESDSIKRRGRCSAASSELEAEASAVYLVLKNVVETQPDTEICLHTDLTKTLPYISGNFKPQTDTMKRFLNSLDKMRKEHGVNISADDKIPAETADRIWTSAFKTEKPKTKVNEPAKAEPVKSVKPVEPVKPAPIMNGKANWGNKRIVRNGGSGTQSEWNNNLSSVSDTLKKLPQEFEGEWVGWTNEGILVTYDSAEDAVQGMCRPIWADGRKGDKVQEDAIWETKKPEKPEKREIHIQGRKAGTGWGQKGVVFDSNPFDAPKRDIKTSAFDGYKTNKTPKPKWRLMAVNNKGQIVSMLDSQKAPMASKEEVEYLADWWEQVEKHTVFRDGIEKGKNDFIHKLGANGRFKGGSVTVADISRDEMFVLKGGYQTYHGKITDEYKRNYVETHNDEYALKWASELQEKEKAAKLRAEQEQKAEQISLFDYMKTVRDDDPFNL